MIYDDINFSALKDKMQANFKDNMINLPMFKVNVSKDLMWDTYLDSFKEGDNPVFKTRTENDCNCCKQFIRDAGNLVAVTQDLELISIWDVVDTGKYQASADALSTLVKGASIESHFLHHVDHVGTDYNYQHSDTAIKWDHFFLNLPNNLVEVEDRIPTKLGDMRATKDVFLRGLKEITLDAATTVEDLIAESSIYRGVEYLAQVQAFIRHNVIYDQLTTQEYKDRYAWTIAYREGPSVRLRGTAIGTLLVDLSKDIPLENAVASYEAKVAPANYKRSSTVVTKRMVESMNKRIVDLGLVDSIKRRHGTLDDITINNVLFVSRDVKAALNVLDQMVMDAPSSKGSKRKAKTPNNGITEIGIDEFLVDVLPKSTDIEVIMENNLSGNLMSVIVPEVADSEPLLSWGNNFSWAYEGDLTDSIKARVKAAGGTVDGFLRASLSWFNYDDLDIRMTLPTGDKISYQRKYHGSTRGRLDVDMNVSSGGSRNAVENITLPEERFMQEGRYVVQVHNFTKRESVDTGFEVELECDGQISSYVYDKPVRDGQMVDVVTFDYSHDNGIVVIESLPSTTSSKTIWGVRTQEFQKVSAIMLSPNHWDGQKEGNKHWFFILPDAFRSGKVRGLYNEFLRKDLHDDRKAFEVLGSKLMVEESRDQLSGLGFSSTKRASLICRTKQGQTNRTYKINF